MNRPGLADLLIVAAFGGIFGIADAQAEKLKITWQFPDKRENGDPLATTELDYTTVIWVCNGIEGSKPITAPENSALVGVPAPGECVYYLTVTDKAGLTSARTDAFIWEGAPILPSPPKGVTVELVEE